LRSTCVVFERSRVDELDRAFVWHSNPEMLPICVIKRLAGGQYDFLFAVEESDRSTWTNLNHVRQSPIGHHLQKRVCGSVGDSGNYDRSQTFSRGLRQ